MGRLAAKSVAGIASERAAVGSSLMHHPRRVKSRLTPAGGHRAKGSLMGVRGQALVLGRLAEGNNYDVLIQEAGNNVLRGGRPGIDRGDDLP